MLLQGSSFDGVAAHARFQLEQTEHSQFKVRYSASTQLPAKRLHFLVDFQSTTLLY